MTPFLESCSLAEICQTLGGSEKLLADLRERLQDWLAVQPHLPQDITANRLDFFLIGTKLSLELAKKKLDTYYTMRRLIPEFFAERDPRGPSITSFHKYMQIVSLPKQTPDKYRVTIQRITDPDSKEFNFWHCCKYTFMIADIHVSECRSIGEIFIFDLAAFRLGHFAKVPPTVLKKADATATNAYPVRIKAIHFINVPPFIDRLISLLKSILKPKLAARIHVHSSEMESLHKMIPKSLLPIDYGGEERSMDELSGVWRDKMDEWRGWFLEQQSVMADESRRPGPTLKGDDLFGFSGSFRKLAID